MYCFQTQNTKLVSSGCNVKILGRLTLTSFTVTSIEAFPAEAVVPVDSILTRGAVLAWIANALVDICSSNGTRTNVTDYRVAITTRLFGNLPKPGRWPVQL